MDYSLLEGTDEVVEMEEPAKKYSAWSVQFEDPPEPVYARRSSFAAIVLRALFSLEPLTTVAEYFCVLLVRMPVATVLVANIGLSILLTHYYVRHHAQTILTGTNDAHSTATIVNSLFFGACLGLGAITAYRYFKLFDVEAALEAQIQTFIEEKPNSFSRRKGRSRNQIAADFVANLYRYVDRPDPHNVPRVVEYIEDGDLRKDISDIAVGLGHKPNQRSAFLRTVSLFMHTIMDPLVTFRSVMATSLMIIYCHYAIPFLCVRGFVSDDDINALGWSNGIFVGPMSAMWLFLLHMEYPFSAHRKGRFAKISVRDDKG